jgi:type IV pilus assembly protein PilM
MLSWIKKRRQSSAGFIGLDLGASSIKLVELNRQRDRYHLQSYAILPLPAGAIVGKEIKDAGLTASVLSRTVQRLGLKNRRVIISVPDSAVISRTIQLDAALTASELEEEVLLAADQHIPYSVAEINLDFQALGSNAKSPTQRDVLLIASHKHYVESRVAVAEAGELEVIAVDVESYAMQRLSHLLDSSTRAKEHLSAIIDVGYSSISCTVFDQKKIIFTRSDSLNEQQSGNETALPPIRRALQFFFAAGGGTQIQQIYLAGGGALLPGIAQEVTAQLGIDAALANPFGAMEINSAINRETLFAIAPRLALGCGLALHGFPHDAHDDIDTN